MMVIQEELCTDAGFISMLVSGALDVSTCRAILLRDINNGGCCCGVARIFLVP